MVDSKTLRRNAREQAVKLFNVLALAFAFDAIPVRATPEEVAELYASNASTAETEEGQQADGRPPYNTKTCFGKEPMWATPSLF